MHSYLTTQKSLFSDAKELATSLAKIYDNNMNMTDWPGVQCDLKYAGVGYGYKDKWIAINDVLRSSTAMVCSEQALEPLKSAVTKMSPEIEALIKERNIRLTDYGMLCVGYQYLQLLICVTIDSYRRRLKEKEQKKESYAVSTIDFYYHLPLVVQLDCGQGIHSGCSGQRSGDRKVQEQGAGGSGGIQFPQ